MSTHSFSRPALFWLCPPCFPFPCVHSLPTSIPVGLELYSVRDSIEKRSPWALSEPSREMGYQCVEFYAPYFDWTEAQTREMKKLLDDLGIRCYSTHNSSSYFTAENLKKARDMNLILGSKYVVMSSSDPKPGWRDGRKLPTR